MNSQCTRLLDDVEAFKQRFENSSRPLDLCNPDDAGGLIRFHEALLFFRAYPPSAKVLKQVETILKTFEQRVSQLREMDADLSPLDDPEVSGIVGTSVTSNFSYAIV